MILPDRYKDISGRMQGGMGEVLVCRDEILQRKVAIKSIAPDADRSRILDEVNALLKLRSKHVVQVYDLVKNEDGQLGIVQEFIDGHDLFANDTRPTSPQDFYKTLWQISSGIADIHSYGLIHRDIKPNNMKRDVEGVIKIFDFGLSREDGPHAETIAFRGTFGFAAPELFNEPATFTKAVDTYAFGATALFIVARSLPNELNRRGIPFPVNSNYFETLEISLVPELSDILIRCLNHNPHDRPLMEDVRNLFAKYLLAGNHQALIVFQGQPSFLSATSPTVRINLPGRGSLTIHYDKIHFAISSVTGDVYINNQRAVIGTVLPGSCVIALGDPAQPTLRQFVTFDLAHPEIVL